MVLPCGYLKGSGLRPSNQFFISIHNNLIKCYQLVDQPRPYYRLSSLIRLAGPQAILTMCDGSTSGNLPIILISKTGMSQLESISHKIHPQYAHHSIHISKIFSTEHSPHWKLSISAAKDIKIHSKYLYSHLSRWPSSNFGTLPLASKCSQYFLGFFSGPESEIRLSILILTKYTLEILFIKILKSEHYLSQKPSISLTTILNMIQDFPARRNSPNSKINSLDFSITTLTWQLDSSNLET